MTATEELLKLKLGRRDLIEWIMTQRDAGDSFERIARRIERDTDVTVSANTLRSWTLRPEGGSEHGNDD